ncbi:sensor histidine kinase [Nocardioides aurantiacus]|uniref:Two-component system sensor histidine kinase DesK n=1 Tax=Nocardioides aurantiacus TaxID=86796 RepID=A0A3N2CU63_9ACTN|nr:histidine kinase [Nocardioides aurantiacus]ROR91067.1 two-component system sensor histidine kinase DesK [Nocardioides aurantiacus]
MSTEVAPRDPWERFGWLMWSGWVVFLVFPVVAALQADRGWAPRLLAVALVLGFAAAYVGEVLRLTSDRHWRRSVPEPVVVLVLLFALAAATVPTIGAAALSFVPFLQSFGVFGLPRPLCWIYAGALLAATALATVLWLGPEDLSLLFILVGVTAAAVAGRLLGEHGQAYESAVRGQDLATERERLARDVHDVLGHSLTVVIVKAELAARLVEADPARAREELADIQRLSREALGEIRATVGGLRAARLSTEIEHAREALLGAGMVPDLPTDERVLDPRYRVVLGWVLREAVTNVVRHSRADRCSAWLTESSLVVEDDGRGLGDTPEGNGLRGLRERVHGAGGHFTVGPGQDGRGTRLEASW